MVQATTCYSWIVLSASTWCCRRKGSILGHIKPLIYFILEDLHWRSKHPSIYLYRCIGPILVWSHCRGLQQSEKSIGASLQAFPISRHNQTQPCASPLQVLCLAVGPLHTKRYQQTGSNLIKDYVNVYYGGTVTTCTVFPQSNTTTECRICE